ncbi:phospholipase D family protein [Klebsiella aerogenes]|uniref:phospholipase D family nuclease n=1 Tax=Klebsiella aerogenes TaxID=548 RepID=UPI0005EDC49D|nr:phospholipase D family protein [Klebsiella aerogenes]ELA0209076.1 phospholipase D family protein [Klebsiella aerogenes]ELA0225171.1 phospholipase D family protein [Klebsiella aerogenes]ELA0230180.1 phospholipase D family protein [Klebsiella aerogenes]KJO57016.1 conjugal transfer protein [Klebsiella aerogenes]
MRKFTFRQLAVSGLVCLSLSCIQPAAAAPSVQVGFSPEGSALQLVLKTIESAQHEIRLMGYSFTSPEVVSALVRAKRRGVDVRIVLDEKGNRSKASQAAMNVVVNAGIPLRTNGRYAIMHDKVIIVDNHTVEAGSFNFSRSAARSNSENVLVIRDYPSLADTYLQHWQSRWDTGTFWVPGY